MSRMAAKFGSGAGTGGGGSGNGPAHVPGLSGASDVLEGHHHHEGQGHKSKKRGDGGGDAHKKFCTRGEEFFDFLKGLGYQPPKHQQYQHFEYLFQDDVSINFVKKLMSAMKTQNCLVPEEIERFETLQKQGFAIYGEDLEEAVQRRHGINEIYSHNKFKRLAKKTELEKELNLQMSELKRLQDFDEAFEKNFVEWQSKQAQASYMAEIIQNLIRDDEREIEIDMKLLNEKKEELQNYVMELTKDLSVHRPQKSAPHYICQIEGRRLIEKEEELFEVIQEMIRKHGTSLIMKDAGYGVEGDPLSVENIKKVFAQFEKDFIRLKHCIIYEKVTQLSIEMAIAGEQGMSSNFEECCHKAMHLSAFDYETRVKLQREALDDCKNLSIAFLREKEEFIDRVRESTLIAVNKIFSTLTNIKTRSKKKLQEFFKVATNALKSQKVRITLIRNLVKAEGQRYGRLLSNIEENLAVSSRHSKKLGESKSIKKSDLSSEGQILHSVLKHLAVRSALDVIASIPKVLTFLRKTSWETNRLYWNTIDEKQSQFDSHRKHLLKTQEMQSQIRKTSTNLGSRASAKRIEEGEEYIKKAEQRLAELHQSRITLLKELQRKREENLLTCSSILQSHQEKERGA